MSDYIDSAIGPDTDFDRTHGYHADGVGPNTASLPEGWKDRLTPICNPNTDNATGWCIDLHDIAIAKYAAGRPKDLRYLHDLWKHGMLNPKVLDHRLHNTTLKPTDKPRDWIEAVAQRQRQEWEEGLRGKKLASARFENTAPGQQTLRDAIMRAEKLLEEREKNKTK